MATFSGIGKLLKDVIFSDLTTTSKNVIGAINELNTGLIVSKTTRQTDSAGNLNIADSNFDVVAAWPSPDNAKQVEFTKLFVNQYGISYALTNIKNANVTFMYVTKKRS